MRVLRVGTSRERGKLLGIHVSEYGFPDWPVLYSDAALPAPLTANGPDNVIHRGADPDRDYPTLQKIAGTRSRLFGRPKTPD